MNWARLGVLREAGYVRRLHATPVLREQTIAEHVYGAQLLALELLEAGGHASNDSRGAVLQALLYHDAPEVWTGDVPAHMKVRHPEIAAALGQEEEQWYGDNCVPVIPLTEYERKVVQAADRLDLAFHLLHERQMGCRHPRHQEIFTRVLQYVMDECASVTGVAGAVGELNMLWEEA